MEKDRIDDHIDKFLEDENKQKVRLAELEIQKLKILQQRSAARHERINSWAIGIVIVTFLASIIFGIGWAIWADSNQPSEMEICVANGGEWKTDGWGNGDCVRN